MNLFTPRLPNSEERLKMKLSAEDQAKIKRGWRWSAEVTDQNTGKRYTVRGAACGSPRCMCDAVIVSGYEAVAA